MLRMKGVAIAVFALNFPDYGCSEFGDASSGKMVYGPPETDPMIIFRLLHDLVRLRSSNSDPRFDLQPRTPL
jgi:hypothetical protein